MAVILNVDLGMGFSNVLLPRTPMTIPLQGTFLIIKAALYFLSHTCTRVCFTILVRNLHRLPLIFISG